MPLVKKVMALAVVIVVGNLGMEIKFGNSGIREIWILRTDGPKKFLKVGMQRIIY